MSLADTTLAILDENIYLDVFQSQKNVQSPNISTNLTLKPTCKSVRSSPAKRLLNSPSSDSGKSSSSPVLLDCSFDSGIAGVLVDGKDMQLHKRIQQCQCILLSLKRDQEYFFAIRNRLSKISKRKQRQSNENELFCNVCCTEIDANDESTYVKCYICKKYICRSAKCSDRLSKTAGWECELCQTSKESLAQTSSWVADQITFNQEKFMCPPRARSEVYIPISEYNDSFLHFESVSQAGANSTTITAEQKSKIREFVEEVVAKLLGGNLDTIAVNQLSTSENYLNLFHKYHSKLSNILINLENVLASNKNDLPNPKVKNDHNGTSQEAVGVRGNGNDFSDISETRLRQMIQKIIAETMCLPPLTNGHAVSVKALDTLSRTGDNRRPPTNNGYYQTHRTEHYFEPTIYQDLLATAVLNKIVDKHLNNNQSVPERNTDERDGDDVNSNIRFTGSDQNVSVEKSSTSSGSSVDPRSDCSYPEMEQILNNNYDKCSEFLRNSDRDSVMSEYLANHMIPLPDLNAMATESDEDDYISVTSSAVGDSTWEKNWLFRKKKSALSGSATANSVGMLVPDPKEDVRAQIGDKTADEVSDLSELGSDSDNSLNSLRSQLEPINDRLFNKHLIGGQNSKLILDEIIERSSMISNTFSSDMGHVYTDACNEHVIDATTKTEADIVNKQQSSTEQKAKDSAEALCSVVLEDLNSNLLTDQLSYDSNPYDGSRTSTVEEHIDNENADEKNILTISPDNKSIINTTLTATRNTKAITNATKNYSHKQSVTNVGASVTITSYKQRHPDNLLTSTAPPKNTGRFPGKLIRREHSKLKVYKDGIDIDIDAGVGVNSNYLGDHDDDGVSKDDGEDDDDVVAIFRHFVPGSIAEREYKKWYNAVEMPNNPYAPEALKRRISSGSQERFIDLPNISPTNDLNPLGLLNEQKLNAEDNMMLESDYKRYSRDYYINSGLIGPRTSSAKDVSAPVTKDNREPPNKTPACTEVETEIDLYKAIPVQVVESISDQVSIEIMSTEVDTKPTSVSDDSDTIKMHDFEKQHKQETGDEVDSMEIPSSLAFNKSESSGNIIPPTRGSTPEAFKFLQPKRRLLEPNQVLTVDEEESQTRYISLEKPVIEAEVVKALPSVKALAKAFLMTTNTTQPQKLWLHKARTLSQGGKKFPTTPKRSLDQLIESERLKSEDDITITSDLSSLETDSSSVGTEIAATLGSTPLTVPTKSPCSPTVAGNTSPVSVRHGVLKNNIAFFENLKNK